jgi:glucose-1-phosphate thymidylyltransferase
VEERQGLMIACPEEIAYQMGYIDHPQILLLANRLKNNSYEVYLLNLVE